MKKKRREANWRMGEGRQWAAKMKVEGNHRQGDCGAFCGLSPSCGKCMCTQHFANNVKQFRDPSEDPMAPIVNNNINILSLQYRGIKIFGKQETGLTQRQAYQPKQCDFQRLFCFGEGRWA